VRSKKLYVPLGAGAEEAEDFEGMWVTLMKSQTASQHIMKCISRLIVTIINNEGRDLRPTDVMLCVAILSAAVDVGKGTRPRDLTRPLAWPLPHALFTAARLARVCTVKPTELLDAESASEEEEEEESEEEEEDEEGLSAPESKSEAKARLKAKLEAKLEAEKEKRKRACVKRWQEEMTPAEKDAYVKAFLMPNQPIELKARDTTQKARTLFLYPMLKEKLREVAPELVPFTSDVEADGIVYVQSKAALEGYESRARKWPRMCKLLCGRDEQGEPCFLYSKEVEDGEEPTPFTAFVDAVAKECEIEPNDISPNLVAFLAFMAGQIACVTTRSRGRKAGLKVQGDLNDHGSWDAGITSALRFMKDRSKCRTHAHLVKAIQKKAKK